MSKYRQKRSLVLGVTGSFGSGKTTAMRMFKGLGAAVIDADEIYHHLLKPKNLLYKKVVATFGTEILKKNKQLDRKKLAKIVFNNKQSLKKLCQITHPAIITRMRNKLEQIRRKVVVIEAPLLIEARLTAMVDKLVVVKINKKNQIKRCAQHRQLSRRQILKRIKLQRPLTEKIKLADYVIDNNGSLQKTREQIKNIWKKIKGR